MKRILKANICSLILALFATSMSCSYSLASDIQLRQTVSETGFKSNSAIFDGQIQRGDAKKVVSFYIKNPTLSKLYLNSPCGDVQEAIAIGEIIKTLRLWTEVETKGKCASACFFIWMNGAWREAQGPDSMYGDAGWIGLHRPFLTNQSNSEASLAAQNYSVRSVSAYLESKLIPRRYIDYMIERPSNDIYWLKAKDILDIGISPPDIEELYIAKCHESFRRIDHQFAEAMKAQDGTGNEIRLKLESLAECTKALDNKAREEAIIKLRNGWLPKVTLQYNK